MKKMLITLALFSTAWAAVPASAVVVCYNNVCGRIVCSHGCIQRSVNGRCVVNRCTGRRADREGDVVEENASYDDSDAAEAAPSIEALLEGR
jgi:hypothetical protein